MDAINVGDRIPALESMYCDGDICRSTMLESRYADTGCIFIFFGFLWGAISLNWSRRLPRSELMDMEVNVCGVARDGMYSTNKFIQETYIDIGVFADVDGGVSSGFGVLEKVDGMSNASAPRRSMFHVSSNGEVLNRWIAGYQYEPYPLSEFAEEVIQNRD